MLWRLIWAVVVVLTDKGEIDNAEIGSEIGLL